MVVSAESAERSQNMIQEYSIYIFYAALFIVCFFFGMLLRKLIPRKSGAAKIDETPKKSRKKSRKDTVTMAEVDAMKGYEFEHFCADLLKKNGFRKVSVTPASGDQGVDIIAVRGTARYAIQCKRYASPLGNKPVQEVYTGKAFYNCRYGVVMTNSTFTPHAKDLAKKTGVLLWDRKTMEKLMHGDRKSI